MILMEIANFGWFWGSKKINLAGGCEIVVYILVGMHVAFILLAMGWKHQENMLHLLFFFNVTHYGVHESSESMWRSAWVSANVRLWFIALFCECSVEHD
jgi:L-asparagine transporter-like permease